uniref:Uncharacterized protein n=1 Tax=Ciona savignyi TaxID=51511 RepID=H2Z5D2_CIOSA
MPATIYAVGHLVCSIPVLKLGPRIRRTVGIEIAFQNVQVCSAVLTTTFLATQPRIFGQLILFPLLYYIFQIAYAVLYLVIVRVGRKYGYFEEEEEVEPVVALTDEKTPADHQAEIGKVNPVYLKEEKL